MEFLGNRMKAVHTNSCNPWVQKHRKFSSYLFDVQFLLTNHYRDLSGLKQEPSECEKNMASRVQD